MNIPRPMLPWLAATALAALACSSSTPPPSPSMRPRGATEVAGMPPISSTDVQRLDGVVHEVLAAGHYTYIRMGAANASDVWAVVLGSVDATVGDPLALHVQGSRADFHSRRLDRDFSELFFARVARDG